MESPRLKFSQNYSRVGYFSSRVKIYLWIFVRWTRYSVLRILTKMNELNSEPLYYIVVLFFIRWILIETVSYSYFDVIACICTASIREISTIEESVRNKKKILVFYASCFLRTSVSYLSFPFYRKRLILSDRSTFFLLIINPCWLEHVIYFIPMKIFSYFRNLYNFALPYITYLHALFPSVPFVRFIQILHPSITFFPMSISLEI